MRVVHNPAHQGLHSLSAWQEVRGWAKDFREDRSGYGVVVFAGVLEVRKNVDGAC